MPFKIIRDDITHISADVIVNSANPHALIGDGVDAAIHVAAGPRLIEARKKIGDIAVGDVRYSRAFDLLAKYVFHTVGPDCRKEEPNQEEKLKACYTKSLQLAKQLSCESIAFPMISTGVYECPRETSMQIAVSAISEFLMQNDMDVTLVVYDPESYVLSTKLFDDVKAYVDEHYVETTPKDAGIDLLEDEDMRRIDYVPNFYKRAESEDALSEKQVEPASKIMWSLETPEELSEETRRDLEDEAINARTFRGSDARMKPGVAVIPPTSKKDLDAIIGGRVPGAETFSEMLLRLIDKSGKRDSDIYSKAGQSKQTFSKIRTNRNYQPSKNTVLSFAIALELNMDQTMDLLKSAGFTLSDGIKMDIAIRFFIENGFYDIFEIKFTLFGMGIEF
jgi:O-acetyl-ADP-ribose deacetylase (regulator of RNase III)